MAKTLFVESEFTFGTFDLQGFTSLRCTEMLSQFSFNRIATERICSKLISLSKHLIVHKHI